jgi:hypothetical protein
MRRGLFPTMILRRRAYIDEQGVGAITDAFSALDRMEKFSFRQMADFGAPLAAEQESHLDAVMKAPAFVSVSLSEGTAPVSVPLIEADVRDYGRGISHKLVVLGKEQGPDVSFCWRKVGDGVYVSIRTDGTPDASKIAEHFCKTMGVTGGGHAAAAAIHFSSVENFNRHFPMKKPPLKPECPRP